MGIDPIHLQQRHAEQGRIRLGQKVTGQTREGKDYTRPAKLETFRFTSPNRDHIAALAALYGGEAKPWDNDGTPEFEVVTEATSIPVVVVKGGVSQWFEHWTRAGIQHRCDGTRDTEGRVCNPDDPNHIAAIDKPTTRLSVMLPELDSTGVWRMETKGWNAAAEIPQIAELAAYVGPMVPARLHLVERRKVIQTKDGPQTSRFVVPVVDLEIKVRDLTALVSGPSVAQIEAAPAAAATTPQITASRAEEERLVDLYTPQIEACLTEEEVRSLWHEIGTAGHLASSIQALLQERRAAIVASDEAGDSDTQAAPPDPNIEDAVVVEDPPYGQAGVYDEPDARQPSTRGGVGPSDPIEDDRAWQDVVAAAGHKKMSALDVVQAYVDWAKHPVDQGNAALYRTFQKEVLS